MQLITKVRLFRSPYTICYISEEHVVLPGKQYYKSIGVKPSDASIVQLDEDVCIKKKRLKYTATAFFLQPFVNECVNSEVYRSKVLSHFRELSGYPENGVVFLNLILEAPYKEVLDYGWNDRLLRLVWTKIEIENAFSWLSTLGGAYSALGDYFIDCAEEAGRISRRQFMLSKMLGDDALAARSCLYTALSHAQKGNLKASRHIVRRVAQFGKLTKDTRLIRMCQGIWAKLVYLRNISNDYNMQKKFHTSSNGKVIAEN